MRGVRAGCRVERGFLEEGEGRRGAGGGGRGKEGGLEEEVAKFGKEGRGGVKVEEIGAW